MNVSSQNAAHALSVVLGVASQLLQFPDGNSDPNHVSFPNSLLNHVCTANLPSHPRRLLWLQCSFSTFGVLESCAFYQPQRDNSQALWLDFSFRVISNRKLIQTNRSDFGSGRNPRNECRTGNVSFLLKEGVVQVKPEATGKMPAS